MVEKLEIIDLDILLELCAFQFTFPILPPIVQTALIKGHTLPPAVKVEVAAAFAISGDSNADSWGIPDIHRPFTGHLLAVVTLG